MSLPSASPEPKTRNIKEKKANDKTMIVKVVKEVGFGETPCGRFMARL